MQVSITGRSMKVTDNTKDHINEKVERCLGMFSKIESVHVILEIEKHDYTSEIVIQAGNHIRVTSSETSENLYDSIDRSIEHAERQMRKHTDKELGHQR